MPVTSLVPPRIIPARAGFTARAPAAGSAPPDHPRSRGVYPSSRSSPTGSPDHPRSRGVYVHSQVKRSPRTGSSPLARGLPMQRKHLWIPRRIIPARAGFTAHLPHLLARRKDHPRSRGVYAAPARRKPRTCGSSPLARGLPGMTTEPPSADRIIPARAGFTSHRPRQGRGDQDHPRSRGVYPAGEPPACAPGGSSPLARGLPAHVHPRRPAGRIIPARAGFTL